MYYDRNFDDKFTPGNVNYREAESNYRTCSYCQHYMSENGSCAYVGGKILPNYVCDLVLESSVKPIPDMKVARRKYSGSIRKYVKVWGDEKVVFLTEDELVKELKNIYRDWREAKDVLDRLGYFGRGVTTFYTVEYYDSGKEPNSEDRGKEIVYKIKKELKRLGIDFSVTFHPLSENNHSEEEDITVWDHRMIGHSFPVPFAETALLRELKKLGHYSYDEEQISSFLSSMVRKIPSNPMLYRMAKREDKKERLKARKFFDSLDNSEIDQIESSLIDGCFDWRDWFDKKPSPEFFGEFWGILRKNI